MAAPRLRFLLPATVFLALLFFTGLLWDSSTAFLGRNGGGDSGGLGGGPGGGSGAGGIDKNQGSGKSVPVEEPLSGGGEVTYLYAGTWTPTADASGNVRVTDDRPDAAVSEIAFSTTSAEPFAVKYAETKFSEPLIQNVLEYKHVDISITQNGQPVPAEKLTDIEVTFQVSETFLTEQRADPSSAVLYTYAPETKQWSVASAAPLTVEHVVGKPFLISFALPHLSLFSVGFKVAAPETCNGDGICQLAEAPTCGDCSTLPICTAGQARCNGKVVEQCTQAGQWKATSICADACVEGACSGGKTASGPLPITATGANTFYLFLGGTVIFLLFVTILLKYAFG